MDELFNQLDKFDDIIRETKKCCDIEENYICKDGIINCSKCGNIVSNISNAAEWRFYGASDSKNSDPTRCGMPSNILLPKSSLGSTISFRGGKSNSMYQVRKFHKWQEMPYSERSLYKVFGIIEETCLLNKIPKKIIEEAKGLYSIISKTKISRGNNRSGIIAATVYFSCKLNNVPRSSKELATIFKIKSTVMTKGVKMFQEILYTNKEYKMRLANLSSIKSADLVDRLCNKLHLNKENTDDIKNICLMIENTKIVSENTPASITGAIIYYVCNKKKIGISKKQIAEVCNISDVTINKCFKKIEDYINNSAT